MMQRRENESVTEFTIRMMAHEIIVRELEELARDFEADPDQPWSGTQIGDYLRDRANNHPTFNDPQ